MGKKMPKCYGREYRGFAVCEETLGIIWPTASELQREAIQKWGPDRLTANKNYSVQPIVVRIGR